MRGYVPHCSSKGLKIIDRPTCRVLWRCVEIPTERSLKLSGPGLDPLQNAAYPAELFCHRTPKGLSRWDFSPRKDGVASLRLRTYINTPLPGQLLSTHARCSLLIKFGYGKGGFLSEFPPAYCDWVYRARKTSEYPIPSRRPAN